MYSDSVKNNKWTTREINAAKIQQKGNFIISETTTESQNELLEKVWSEVCRRRSPMSLCRMFVGGL